MGSAFLKQSHARDLAEENLVIRPKATVRLHPGANHMGRDKHGGLSLELLESLAPRSLQPNRGCW